MQATIASISTLAGIWAAQRRWRSQHLRPVVLDEGLQNQVVRVIGRDALVQLLEHSGGHGAADVIAGSKNLRTAAHAHHFGAQSLGPVRALRIEQAGEQRQNGQ
jgi:hypothetical protein